MMRAAKHLNICLIPTALTVTLIGVTPVAHGHGVNERPKRTPLLWTTPPDPRPTVPPDLSPPPDIDGAPPMGQTLPGPLSTTPLIYPNGNITDHIIDQGLGGLTTRGVGDLSVPLLDLGGTATLPNGNYFGAGSHSPVPTPGALPLLLIGALCLKRRRR